MNDQGYRDIIKAFKEKCGVIFPKGEKAFSEDVIVIVMSRKMVRLLDWILQLDKDIEIPYPIVSEHAIPFCFPAYKDKQIVVLDDSMFYGATLLNIKEVLGWCKGSHDKIRFVPIVARNKNALVNLNIKEKDTFFLEEKEVPFYTYTNVLNMLSLNAPMEVEYPILRFKRKESKSLDADFIEGKLKEVFPSKSVYRVSHKLSYKNKGIYGLRNYTVLLNTSRDTHNYEFAKLRIYVQDEYVLVVPIAPLIFPNDILNTDMTTLFENSYFLELWTIVKEKLKPIAECGMEYSEQEKTRIQREYELRKYKSLEVWANYLASYSKLLEYRDHLNSFLKFVGCGLTPTIKIKDIKYIIGHQDNYNIEVSLLNNVYNAITFKPIKKMRFRWHRVDEVIPLEYASEYDKRNAVIWSQCKSVTHLLSFMFANQHYYINKALNETTPEKIEKTRFGVTYASMMIELANYIGKEDKEKSLQHIHQWIDKKIDEGTVVPKSEQKYDNATNTHYWRRFFKSGENEDAFLYLIRICLYLYIVSVDASKNSSIKRIHFEELLIILFCNFGGRFTMGYALVEKFNYKWNSDTKEWRLTYYDEIIDKWYAVVDDLLCAFSFFKLEIRGGQECICLKNNSMTEFLSKAVPLSEEKCKHIEDVVKVYFSCMESYMTPFNNFRLNGDETIEDLNGLADKVKNFVKRFNSVHEIEKNLNGVESISLMLEDLYKKTVTQDIPSYFHPKGIDYSSMFFHIVKIGRSRKDYNDSLSILLMKWDLFLCLFVENDMQQAIDIANNLENTEAVKTILLDYKNVGEIKTSVKDVLLKRVVSDLFK